MTKNAGKACQTKMLLAGVAQVDITPPIGTHISGEVGWHRPAREICDPLYAKALIFASGERQLCLVYLDLTIVTEEWTTKIREVAARRFGFAPEAVMVHATQNHTAPPLGQFMVDPDFKNIPEEMEWLAGGEARYFQLAFAGVVEAISKARAGLEPVTLRTGSGIEGRVQFNRRAIQRDGTVRMPGFAWSPPLGPSYICYLEGPIDPEVGVLCVESESRGLRALLLHHTAHPVNVFPRQVISADWCGAWAAELRQKYGPDCVPLVLNGCCGNINPWNPFDPEYQPDHLRMGHVLSQTAQKVIETLEPETDCTLDFGVRHVSLPFREIEPELLAKAAALLRHHPRPCLGNEKAYAAYEDNGNGAKPHVRAVDPEWMQAASVMSTYLEKQRRKSMNYEIQAFRVGRTVIVGLPGEPFVEGQLAIKMKSPAYRTFVAHCCNAYCGYVPTREAFKHPGGHETETRYWSKLVPEALDLIVEAATDLLDEMFSPRPTSSVRLPVVTPNVLPAITAGCIHESGSFAASPHDRQ
jgi:hypothetical protein